MRDVRDNLDLAQLQAAGEGFIVNARLDRRMVHQSRCEAVGAMVSTAYPKIFFEDPNDAKVWLNTAFGEQGWRNCGVCGGLTGQSFQGWRYIPGTKS